MAVESMGISLIIKGGIVMAKFKVSVTETSHIVAEIEADTFEIDYHDIDMLSLGDFELEGIADECDE